MTREIAEKIAKGITDKIECNTADIDDWAEFWGFTREEYEKFLDMAIKALEQEPILDKLRAELHATAEMHEDGGYCIRDEWIDEYFDKYKAESEDT